MDAVVESRGSSTDYYRVEFHSSTAEVSCAAGAVEKFKSDSWIRVATLHNRSFPTSHKLYKNLSNLLHGAQPTAHILLRISARLLPFQDTRKSALPAVLLNSQPALFIVTSMQTYNQHYFVHYKNKTEHFPEANLQNLCLMFTIP